MHAPRIVSLDHCDPAMSELIHATQMLAYAQEAALLNVEHFPPLERRPADVRSCAERFLGAFLGDGLVGAVSIGLEREPQQLNIASLVVAPTYQRRGIGRLLLAAALNECRGSVVTVSTGANNAPALALYAGFGFVECDRRTVGPQALPLVKLLRPSARPPVAAILRPATLAGADAIFDTHRDAMRTLCAGAYTEAQLRVWFEGCTPAMYRSAIEASQVWLAEVDGAALGFVGFVPGEVTLLFVRSSAAGRGLGRQLFALGLERARAGFDGDLTVVATRNSRGFYEAHGFEALEVQSFVRGDPAVHFEVIRMQQWPLALRSA